LCLICLVVGRRGARSSFSPDKRPRAWKSPSPPRVQLHTRSQHTSCAFLVAKLENTRFTCRRQPRRGDGDPIVANLYM
jgi:hypothetical protein